VILRRRSRFGELVRHQLELFTNDEGELLAEIPAAESAWTRSSRAEAEASYGELQVVLDAVGERLLDLRETYAATLPDHAADGYRRAFTQAALRRFGRGASLLEEGS
jgi:hypothetical protein